MKTTNTPEAIEEEVKSLHRIASTAPGITADQQDRINRRINALLDRLLPLYGGKEIAGFPRYPGGRKFQVMTRAGASKDEAMSIAMCATETGMLSVFARTPEGAYQFVIVDSVVANHYEFRRYLIERGFPGVAVDLHIS